MENKDNKVLFIGMPSTGKTTLIREVQSLERPGLKYYSHFDTDYLYFFNDDRKANKFMTLSMVWNIFKIDREMGDGSSKDVNYLLLTNYYDVETVTQLIKGFKPNVIYFATFDSFEDYHKSTASRSNHYVPDPIKAQQQWSRFNDMVEEIESNNDLKSKIGYKSVKFIQPRDGELAYRNIQSLARELMAVQTK